jgi:hypothetical protein
MSNIIGNFKSQSKVGTFKWENSAEAGVLRNKVEKFVAKNPISNQAWHNYAELRALREVARSIDASFDFYSLDTRDTAPTEEELEYNKLWDAFCNAKNPDGSSRFGLARVVEQQVLVIDPWA